MPLLLTGLEGGQYWHFVLPPHSQNILYIKEDKHTKEVPAIMRKYDYGVKTLKSNASVSNSFGKVVVTTNTTKTNDNTIGKLKNKTYYTYKTGGLQNRTRPKTF